MGKNLKGEELGKGFSQRPDGRYEARVVINGQKIDIYNTNLKLLKKEFEEQKAILERATSNDFDIDVTLNEWYSKWFENYKKASLKSTNQNAYNRKFVNNYGSKIGFVKLTELTQLNVQKATKSLIEDDKRSARYVSDGLGVLKQCLDCAVANKIIDSNPCIGVIVPTTEEEISERRVLTQEEQKKILEYTDNTFYREAYRFLLLTGLRIGELGGLRWDDIDWENEFIYVRHSLACVYTNHEKVIRLVSPKTRNSVRKIPFFGETKKVLLEQKEKQERLKKQLGNSWRSIDGIDNLVFTTSMGSPVTRYAFTSDVNTVSEQLDRMEWRRCIETGDKYIPFEKVYPHAFRHTFATRCFEKGLPVQTVQKLMGHSNINTTMVYTHVLEDELKKAAEEVGDLL